MTTKAKMKDGLVQRGNGWSYVVRVADPATGKTKPKWVGGYKTRKEAREARDQARAKLGDGSYVEPSKLTVAEFLRDRWLPAIEATGKRSTTLRNYRMHVERHIVPRIGGMRLQAVTGDVLNQLYAVLLKDGRHDGQGGLSPATVRRVHALMSKSLGDAERWSLVPLNAAKRADPPKQAQPGAIEMATWTAPQVRRFLESVADHELYPLFLVYATTGMRRGEALGLRWSDVDLDAGRAAVRQTLVVVGHEVQVSQPKTKRGRRSVALDAATVAALRAHRKRQAEQRLAWGPGWAGKDLVFTREDGEWLHPERISKTFTRLTRAAELPEIRLHDLRHTYATLALEAGVHPKVVSERLGHSTISFTLDVYSHSVPALEEEAAETVARLVLG